MKQIFTILLCSLFLSFAAVAQNASIDLELDITTNRIDYDLYQQKIVRFELKNNGMDTARNVIVFYGTDSTLAFVQVWSNTTGTTKGWDGTWVLNAVAPDETVFLSIAYLPIVDFVSPQVRAQVMRAEGEDIDSTPGNADFSGDLEDDEAVLTFTTSRVPPGITSDLEIRLEAIDTVYSSYSSFDFRVTVINNGPDRATNVKVNASVPNGFLISNGFGLDMGDIAAGDSSTRIGRLYIEDYLLIGENLLTATVSSDQIDDNPNNDSDSMLLEPAIALPYVSSDSIDLGVIVTSNSPTYQEFKRQDFTVKLFNRIATEVTLVRVKISPSVFSEFKYAGHELSQGEYAILETNWDIPFLAVGDTAVLQLSLFPTADNRPIEFVARAYCSNFYNNRRFAYNLQREVNCADNTDTLMIAPADENANFVSNRTSVTTSNIYPNPAQQALFVVLNYPIATSEQLVIYNELGQEVRRQTVSLEEGYNKIELDVRQLNKGIYLLKLTNGIVRKFVKN